MKSKHFILALICVFQTAMLVCSASSYGEEPTYTIAATATEGGSFTLPGDVRVIYISPPDITILVDHGSSQRVIMNPNTGYHIADVVVDGVSVGAVGSYTFSAIDQDHTIDARFINIYSLSIITANGTVAVSLDSSTGTEVGDRIYTAGSVLSLTATPADSDYTFARWSGGLSGSINPETLTMDSNKSIIAYFSKDGERYHVDPSNALATDDPSSPLAGSQSTPFRTITHALNYMAGGNKLRIYEWVYKESVYVNTAGIDIEAFGEVVIDAEGEETAMLVEADNINIKGLEFTNARSYGMKITGNNIKVEDCLSYNNGGKGSAGFFVDGASSVAFKKCIAYENIGSAHGFHIINSDNVTIDTCIARDNARNGFDLGNSTNSIITKSVSCKNKNGFVLFGGGACIARQNVAFENALSGFYAARTVDADAFYNNTTYKNSGYGFDIAASTYDAIIINNIADSNSKGDAVINIDPSRLEGNYWSDISLEKNPGFIDPDNASVITDISASNFAKCPALGLSHSSVCRDAGVSLALVDQAVINSDSLQINADPKLYFRAGDEIRIGGAGTATITGITGAVTLNKTIDAELDAEVNLAVVEGVPDIGAYERSSCPWNFNQDTYGDYPYYYPVYGEAKHNRQHLAVGDWVGAFDEDGNCYGVGQYEFNSETQKYYYTLSAYPESIEDGFPGIREGERIYFRYYITGTGEEIEVMSNRLKLNYYPDVKTDFIDPVRINLSNISRQHIPLKKGWNFISFNVRPVDASIVNAFDSIKDNIEYVTDHESWWDKDIGGSLTEVNTSSSYYIKVDEDCVLEIVGLKHDAPLSVLLKQGWNSIGYIYSNPKALIAHMLKAIREKIAWIKTANTPEGNWCLPGLNDIILKDGKGMFIKMKEESEVILDEEDET